MDFNGTDTTEKWPGQIVDNIGPLEEWDLITWPKHGFTDDEFEQVFDRMKTLHINGQPMRVGYVVEGRDDAVEVLEAEPNRLGGERIKNAQIQMPTIVHKRDIVAKKQREHNPRYQDEKRQVLVKRMPTSNTSNSSRTPRHLPPPSPSGIEKVSRMPCGRPEDRRSS